MACNRDVAGTPMKKVDNLLNGAGEWRAQARWSRLAKNTQTAPRLKFENLILLSGCGAVW